MKWLDREYDTRLKQMIEDEIVTHEFRYIREHASPEDGQLAAADDEGWEDTAGAEEAEHGDRCSEKREEPMSEAAKYKITPRPSDPLSSADEEILEEELMEDGDIHTHLVQHEAPIQDDDQDLFSDDEGFGARDDGISLFDDDNGDPLTDDDLI